MIRNGERRGVWGVCLLLLVFATGCAPSHIIAKKIVAAPNANGGTARREAIAAAWEKFVPVGTTNPCVSVSVPVGPPDATINALAVPPRNYHLKFISTVEQDTNGKRRLSLVLAPNADDSFTPLRQPATVIVLHGYMMYKETMAPWALTLAQAGYRVVLVDLRGHGDSTGSQISFGKHETQDLMQVLDHLQREGLCDGQIGVLGFSYGATIGLHWAAHDPRVATVVAIAPYNRPDEAIVRCAKALKISIPDRIARKALARASTTLDLKWTDWSGEAAIMHIKRPMLLIGASKDTICPPEDIATMSEAAANGSKSIVIPEANHQVLGMWLHQLSEPVTSWFNDHLQGRLQASVETRAPIGK